MLVTFGEGNSTKQTPLLIIMVAKSTFDDVRR
jgi:hypothetical protein